ncbi:sensor histidine kinase YesM [Aquimarina sp. EL_43]|uniref:sensor histidine kinase n=1 Tax=Aquimarina TaxID=290174 RepID=UPI000470186D|nr:MULTISPECIES: HAMP domain-containing sensor histidine kinase [Aquimarina]MBG6131939.1 sensor histidine kinase YesM [Aquimarina sp. EL_35]MBG6149503.1 sensor histidine kinase YesM [Aquimarina sp. EL_32]MBG6170234.1 sensor histidine kinase YesM [Aquimarina sp. EL_43]
MNFSDERNFSSYFIIIAVLVITGLVLWNTSLFMQRLKDDERTKVEIWVQSQKALDSEQSDDYLELSIVINTTNKSIPIIITDSKGDFIRDSLGKPDPSYFKNLSKNEITDEEKLKSFLKTLKSENDPIELDLKDTVQYIYYGNSDILNKLKYYPMTIAIIIFLLIGVIYFFFTTSKASEQNKLWAGMAKETAHQIGTPLSSLVGWNEILKTENVNPEYIVEIEKDIERLKIITERFSKIGSIPNLEDVDIVEETRNAYTYLQSRSSKLINFSLNLPDKPIHVSLNSQLYSWTIENLVKNAIDAMRGKGDLNIDLIDDAKRVFIRIKDTGKGIPKSKFTKIFEPGYTSKSRGWGLGLSLSKRIIEEYHLGKIKVLKSDIGKGTTFQITLRKSGVTS